MIIYTGILKKFVVIALKNAKIAHKTYKNCRNYCRMQKTVICFRKKMLKKLLLKIGALANCMALVLVMQSANTACGWIVHQPKFPEDANKYKKVK